MTLKNLAIGTLLASSLVFVGCGDDDGMGTDTGPGGADTGPGGTDTGPGGTDTGPGGTDTGPGGTDAGPMPLPGTCAAGTCFFVADVLDAPVADPGTGAVIGANLDMEITAGGDPGGCGKADYVHPDGTMGIDNALVALLPIIEMGGEPVGQQLAAQIADGSLLITIKLEGADGMNDDSVMGTLYPDGEIPGGGAPMLDGETLAAGQTIDIASEPITINGTITNGRFEAALGALPVEIPVSDTIVVLNVGQALFSADITENGLENGQIAGSLDIGELSAAIGAGMLGGLTEEAAMTILSPLGDLEPDATGNVCARLSLGLGFNAIPAVEGADVSE